MNSHHWTSSSEELRTTWEQTESSYENLEISLLLARWSYDTHWSLLTLYFSWYTLILWCHSKSSPSSRYSMDLENCHVLQLNLIFKKSNYDLEQSSSNFHTKSLWSYCILNFLFCIIHYFANFTTQQLNWGNYIHIYTWIITI